MKKVLTKILTFTLCICAVIGVTTNASAATIQPFAYLTDAQHVRLNGTNKYMNALTTTSAVEGTKVSLYDLYEDDAAQKFYLRYGRLRNSSNNNLVVAMHMGTSEARFANQNNVSDLAMINLEENTSNGGKFSLESYDRYMGTYGTANASYVYFKPASDNTYNVWFFHKYN